MKILGTPKKWLITGGAGYIGAHIVSLLSEASHEVVVFDNLSNGILGKISGKAEFYFGDITNQSDVADVFRKSKFDIVINLAALKSVEDSEKYPELYNLVNCDGTKIVIDAALRNRTKIFIQSSTAAVYGSLKSGLASENDPLCPISNYGNGKKIAESFLNLAIQSGDIKGTSLRYFNVAGSSKPELRDSSRSNLIPMVLEDLAAERNPRIFGGDYPTIDGTCIRDFIHVEDIARAHILAALVLERQSISLAINIGTGAGYSVKQIIDEILCQTKSQLLPIIVARRNGDPVELIADVTLAKKELGFAAEKSLSEIVASSIL